MTRINEAAIAIKTNGLYLEIALEQFANAALISSLAVGLASYGRGRQQKSAPQLIWLDKAIDSLAQNAAEKWLSEPRSKYFPAPEQFICQFKEEL